MTGYLYSRDTVERLLDAVWDDDWAILASKGEQLNVTGGLPSDGMDAVCSAADVRKAWARLTPHDKDLIRSRYLHTLGFDAIAELAGYDTAQKAADEVESAIGLLVDLTNGAQR